MVYGTLYSRLVDVAAAFWHKTPGEIRRLGRAGEITIADALGLVRVLTFSDPMAGVGLGEYLVPVAMERRREAKARRAQEKRNAGHMMRILAMARPADEKAAALTEAAMEYARKVANGGTVSHGRS